MGETGKNAPGLVSLPLRAVGRSGGTTVGIHVEEDGLRLAKISKAQVTDCRHVPFARGLSVSSVEFVGVLKSALSGFLRQSRRPDIWVACDFPDINVRQLRLPRVPSRQLSNAVYWSFRKEAPFDDQATVFDFVVDGETSDEGARKTIVTAYAVSAERLRDLRLAFERAGYALTGVTLPLFSFRNMFTAGWLAVSDPTAVCLYIGEDESDIMVFSSREIATVRMIKTGLRALVDLANQNSGGVLTLERARKMILGLGRDEPRDALPEGAPTDEALFAMIEPGLSRLVRQIEQTVSSSFAGRGIEQLRKMYVSGPIWLSPRILGHISEQAGVTLQVVNPLTAHTSLRPGTVSDVEAALAASAVGVALSDPHRTPNLLRTHKEREREERIRRFNIGIFAAFVLGLLALGATLLFHWSRLKSERMTRAVLEGRLNEIEVKLDTARITETAARASGKLAEVRGATSDHRMTAAISEVIELTPASIRLTALALEVPPTASAAPSASAASTPSSAPVGTPVSATLRLEGLVLGERGAQEAILAKYAVDLDDSPLLGGTKVSRQSAAKEVPGAMAFALTADLAEGR